MAKDSKKDSNKTDVNVDPWNRQPNGKFGKGNKGGGITKERQKFLELAREKAPECLEKLFDIAMNGRYQRDQIQACDIIITRGYGKPKDSIDEKDKNIIPEPIVIPTEVYKEMEEQAALKDDLNDVE